MTPANHPEAKAKIVAKAADAFFVQDYSGSPRIEGVEIVELKRFNDDGGAITELGRLTQGAHAQLEGFEVKQFNYSEMEPGRLSRRSTCTSVRPTCGTCRRATSCC